MKQVTLHIPDNKYPLFMELAHSLNFVKKIEVEENPSKAKIVKGIKQAIKEVNLVAKQKLFQSSISIQAKRFEYTHFRFTGKLLANFEK